MAYFSTQPGQDLGFMKCQDCSALDFEIAGVHVKKSMHRIDEIRKCNNGSQAIASPPRGVINFHINFGLEDDDRHSLLRSYRNTTSIFLDQTSLNPQHMIQLF